MRQVTVAEWVWALRSGFYKQITGEYRKNEGHCAMGVLYDLAGAMKDDRVDFSIEMGHWNFMLSFLCHTAQFDMVVTLNDAYGKSFSEIAAWIETNVKDRPGKPAWTAPANPEDGARTTHKIIQPETVLCENLETSQVALQ